MANWPSLQRLFLEWPPEKLSIKEPARPGTHQVFGNGSRICPGNMLARLQLALFLHHLSVGYKWELLDPDADMNYLSHQMPVDGVEIVFDKI
ncbi:ent-kaurenoic acid oxidase 1-like [Populus alba]|uniref:ent-kaurenoic acid oxidase 1-like n=1 Tax=Populus alba TaxID=43335 RepID=UPI003CC7470B